MATLLFRDTIASGWDWLDIGIRDLEIRATDAGPALYTMSGPGGGLSGWWLSGGNAPVLADTQAFTQTEEQVVGRRILGLGDGLILGGSGAAGLKAYMVSGVIGSRISWDGMQSDAGAVTALAGTADGFAYITDELGGAIRCYQQTGPGDFASLGALAGSSATYRGAVIDLDTVTLAGQSFLLATDAAGRGVSSYRIDTVTGDLEARGMMGAQQGLGVMAPVALETVTLTGKTYAVLASAGGSGGALSVMRLHSAAPFRWPAGTSRSRFGHARHAVRTGAGYRCGRIRGAGLCAGRRRR